MRFDVKYYNRGNYSHKYSEEWVQTDLFCPGCGGQPVYEEQSQGDYYVGVEYLCSNCGATFYLPHGVSDGGNEQDRQRLMHINAHKEDSSNE